MGRTPSGAATQSATSFYRRMPITRPTMEMTPGPGCRVPDCGRPAGSRDRVAATRPALSGLGEAELLPLHTGAVEGGDDDELVAVPLGGLAEPAVARLSVRGQRGTAAE